MMKRLLLLAALLLGCLPVMATIPAGGASGECGDNLTWMLSENGTLTISGSGAMKNYTTSDIPWKDYQADIKSLNLPEGLTSIGKYAFFQCSGLDSVGFPQSLTTIGDNAFKKCSGLKGLLSFPEGLTSIGSYTFYGCSGLKGLLSFPEGLTSIASYAFYGCSGLDSVRFPQSLTTIGKEAFRDCSGLKGALHLPDKLTQILGSTFSGCSGLTSVHFPQGLTYIGGSAFYNCSGLKDSLSFPDGLTSIGTQAFQNCSGLTGSLVFPKRLTTLENSAFSGCSGLTGPIVFPEGLTSIGKSVFYADSNLRGSLNFPKKLKSIGESAFHGCKSLTGSLIFPDSLSSIGEYAFSGCSGLTGSIILPEGLTAISNYAFAHCSGLTGQVNFPDNLTSIGTYAFFNCQKLTSLSFPAGLETFENHAFDFCIGLRFIINKRSDGQDINSTVFEGVPAANVILYVYSADTSRYKGNSAWNTFKVKRFPWIRVYPNLYAYGEVTGGGEYVYGTTDTLTAIPKSGYKFVKWNDDSTANPRVITVTQDSSFTATFLLDKKFTVTASANDEAFGTVTGGGEYDYGTEVTLTANPNEHYHFVRWDESNSDNTKNPRTITVTQDSTFTAIFEKDRHTLTVNVNNDDYGYVVGGGSYAYGTEVSLTATPQTGYSFVKWGDGETQNPRRFTITSDTVFTAVFGATYQIEAKPADYNGTVYGGGYYGEGAEVVLKATPDYGYKFERWNDDTTTNPRTIIVTGNATYTAYFVKEVIVKDTVDAPAFVGWQTSYQDSALVNLHCNTLGAQIFYREGSSGAFSNWKGAYYVYKTTTIEAYAMATGMESSAIVSAVYTVVKTEPTPPVQQDTTYTLTVVASPEEGGTVSGSGTYKKDTTVQIKAVANEGYKFVQWQEDNDTNAVRSIKVTANATYTAEFAEDTPTPPVQQDTTYTLTVQANNAAWGTVSGSGTYKKDTTVQIKAVANDGYKFVQWQEDNDTNAVRSIKVVENATYTAVFEAVEGPGVDNTITNPLTATRVYPNPNNGRFTIDVAEAARMEVYNAAGIRVMSAELTAGKREVSLPTAGIYFIKLTAGDRSDCANCANRSVRSTVKRVVVR